MKVLDLTLKDLLRSTRNATFWVFAFGVPFLTAVIFYFAFGGLAGQSDGFELPQTGVRVVNLDAPSAQFGGFSMGQMLVDVLASEGLSQVMRVYEDDDPDIARDAVDQQHAGVAVIIPEGLTAAAFSPQETAAVEVYRDPTLTIGPSIVSGVVSQLVDGFAGSKIASSVASEQLAGHGVMPDARLSQDIGMAYGAWSAQIGQGFEGESNPLVDLQPISKAEEAPDLRTKIVSQVLAGMMVFYVFTTGANTASSILQEEESGTLQRLFSTPTRQSAVLGGKFAANLVTLTIQVVILVVVTSLAFGINWGRPLPVALVTLGLVVLSASFGIFVTSLLKDQRQAGIVYGGAMTVLGMVAMMRTFNAAPGAAKAINTISLFVPHGWGVLGWQELLAGGGLADVWWIAGVMLLLGGIFFAIGHRRFLRRFA